MSARPLRIVGVGTARALRDARRDERFDITRCEDALDALALSVGAHEAPDALVFDAASAQRESMVQVAHAARHAGLPEPIVVDDDETPDDLLRLIDERERARHERTDAPPANTDDLAGLLDAARAVLEGGSMLDMLLRARSVDEIEEIERSSEAIDHAAALLARADEHLQNLRETARTDAHTGLPDRRALLDRLPALIEAATASRTPFTLRLVRLEPEECEDVETIRELAREALFAAVASWGVVALVVAGDASEHPLGPPDDGVSDAICPWDGVDGPALLARAEAGLRHATRTKN